MINVVVRWASLIIALSMTCLTPVLASSVGNFATPVILLANEDLLIASRMDGSVTRITVEEGERFSQGDLLVEFDCQLFHYELARTKAELAAKTSFAESKERLVKRKSGSKSELEVARHEVAAAKANVDRTASVLHFCRVVAPFDGVVVKRFVDRFEYRRTGDDLIAIQDNQALLVKIKLPVGQLPLVYKGAELVVRMDGVEGGYRANIERIGNQVDPINQTVNLFARMAKRYKDLRPGMIGIARLVVE